VWPIREREKPEGAGRFCAWLATLWAGDRALVCCIAWVLRASTDTVLRRVTQSVAPVSDPGKVRISGVDDWAWRKHQKYGTMLMDLERIAG
jgi:hypothetical protein